MLTLLIQKRISKQKNVCVGQLLQYRRNKTLHTVIGKSKQLQGGNSNFASLHRWLFSCDRERKRTRKRGLRKMEAGLLIAAGCRCCVIYVPDLSDTCSSVSKLVTNPNFLQAAMGVKCPQYHLEYTMWTPNYCSLMNILDILSNFVFWAPLILHWVTR